MIALTPKPLGELEEWQAGHEAELRRMAEARERRDPGVWRRLKERFDRIDALKGSDGGYEKQRVETLAAIEEDMRQSGKEYSYPHEVRWDPFRGCGRYSSDGRWHVAWGHQGNHQNRRVAVSLDGEMRLWLEPGVRVLEAWISNHGGLCLKDHPTDDEVRFTFTAEAGGLIYEWRREWRFLTFLRFDADGLGFAYDDEKGVWAARIDAPLKSAEFTQTAVRLPMRPQIDKVYLEISRAKARDAARKEREREARRRGEW